MEIHNKTGKKKTEKPFISPVTLRRKQRQSEFINELIRQNYHIGKTTKKLKLSPKAYYEWMRDDEEFARQIEILREQEIDVIEDAFRHLVREKNPQAVIFGLKTRGAKRGYQEKQHIEHFGATGIQIKFIEPGEEGTKEDDEEKAIQDNDTTDS